MQFPNAKVVIKATVTNTASGLPADPVYGGASTTRVAIMRAAEKVGALIPLRKGTIETITVEFSRVK